LTYENQIKIYNVGIIAKFILVLRGSALGTVFNYQITPVNRQIPANLNDWQRRPVPLIAAAGCTYERMYKS